MLLEQVARVVAAFTPELNAGYKKTVPIKVESEDTSSIDDKVGAVMQWLDDDDVEAQKKKLDALRRIRIELEDLLGG